MVDVSHMYIPRMKDTLASEHRPKILIVDDEDNLRRILATMLEGFGYNVTAARDGADGVSMLDADPEIRFVLCDVRMPKMNGMAFLDAVSGRGLQVVMMSAYGTTDTAVEALGRGAADYISKPFRPDEIEFRSRASWSVISFGKRTRDFGQPWVPQRPSRALSGAVRARSG